MAKGQGSGVVLGYLKYVLGFDSLAFQQGLGDADKRLKAAQRSLTKTAGKFSDIGTKLSLALTAPLVAFAAKGISEARETREALAQVDAAISSMGNAAGRSSSQLTALADKLELSSLYEGDEILRKVTANLLTFGNVAGETFDRAQRAAVDLATRMGTDLQSATIMVGKALNDPVKGLTSLGRAGIQFSEAQKAQIKGFVATGQAAKAQSVILGELERQFGGAAAAAQNVDPFNKLSDAFNQMAERVGNALLPLIAPLTETLVGLLDAFGTLSPEVQKWVFIAGAAAAALGPLMFGIGGLISAFSAILPLLGGAGLAAAMAALGPIILPVAAAVAALVAAWVLFGDKIGPVLTEFGAKVQAVLGPQVQELISSVGATLTELWNGPLGEGIRKTIALFVQFQVIYARVFGQALIVTISAIVDIFKAAFAVIGGLLTTVSRLLQGDFSGAWQAAQVAVITASQAMFRALDALTLGGLSAITKLVEGVGRWLGQKLREIFKGVTDGIQWVGDKFKWLYDVVVGHSYIPDMVDGIKASMDRLDSVLVAKAQAVTSKTAKAFRDLAEEVAPLLDRLFPEAAEQRKFESDLALLTRSRSAGLIDAAGFAAGKQRLAQERFPGDASSDSEALLGDTTLSLVDSTRLMGEAVDRIATMQLPKLQGGLEAFGQSLADTVQSISGAVQSLVGLFRSDAPWWEKVLGAVEVGARVYSGFAGSGGGMRAGGGAVMAGRTYMVGERGPEPFTPNRSGFITPARGNGRGRGGNIIIHANDAVLASTVRQWVNEGMQMAESGAVVRIARSDHRRKQRKLGR
jgi:hypothetical protein